MVLILRKTGPRSSDSGRKKVGTGAYIPGLRGLKTTDSRDGMGRRRGCLLDYEGSLGPGHGPVVGPGDDCVYSPLS